jgi:hypothetical protein
MSRKPRVAAPRSRNLKTGFKMIGDAVMELLGPAFADSPS